MTSLLITTDSFAPYADICVNVDPERLNPWIGLAQRKHLQPVLGKSLYNDLVLKKADSVKETEPVPLSPQYLALIEALTPFLCYTSYAEFLPYSNSVATPFGTVIKNSEYSKPVDAASLALQARNAMDTALMFKNDLLDYLKENFSTDALYTDQLPKEDETRVSSSTVIPIGKCDKPVGISRIISL